MKFRELNEVRPRKKGYFTPSDSNKMGFRTEINKIFHKIKKSWPDAKLSFKSTSDSYSALVNGKEIASISGHIGGRDVYPAKIEKKMRIALKESDEI